MRIDRIIIAGLALSAVSAPLLAQEMPQRVDERREAVSDAENNHVERNEMRRDRQEVIADRREARGEMRHERHMAQVHRRYGWHSRHAWGRHCRWVWIHHRHVRVCHR